MGFRVRFSVERRHRVLLSPWNQQYMLLGPRREEREKALVGQPVSIPTCCEYDMILRILCLFKLGLSFYCNQLNENINTIISFNFLKKTGKNKELMIKLITRHFN